MEGKTGLDESSLVWMVKNGDLEALKEAVEKYEFDINTLVAGRYPIHYAADYGHRHLLEYLLSNGARVNEIDRHGITPLLAAIWEGHTDCVQVLLNNNADANGRTPDGLTFLEAADKNEIRNLLEQYM